MELSVAILINWSAYQYQIIQFYPKQSSTDVQGKPFIKRQKIKHAASKGSFQRAASEKYIKKKLVLSGKTNMRNHMQMTGVREGAPEMRGTM
jgi:tetrahydromethanopterin S-methyltransferase subunit H